MKVTVSINVNVQIHSVVLIGEKLIFKYSLIFKENAVLFLVNNFQILVQLDLQKFLTGGIGNKQKRLQL